MAATRTLKQMREQALRYADLDGFSSVVEAANHFVNARVKELYDELIRCRGDDYYSVDATTKSEAGKSLYTWGDFGANDFYRLVAFRMDDGNYHAEPDGFSASDLPDLLYIEGTGSVWHPAAFRRRLRPGGIEVRPAPQSTNYTLTLTYIPSFSDLETDQDTFDGINGWERWAELGAAIDLREKEEVDASGLISRQAQIGERIRALAGTRDMGRPARRRLTRRRRRGTWDDCSW